MVEETPIQKAWRSYVAANTQIIERLDHEIQQRSHISLTDYEILSTLIASPERRVRMSELAAKVLVSRSRLTYRVDRLVDIGYLEREECSDDRRGLWAILTDQGMQAFIAAKPGHEQDIQTWFFEHLDPEETEMLIKVTSRMRAKLESNR